MYGQQKRVIRNASCGTAKVHFNWWKWSYDFNVIALDLAAFNVSLLVTIQILTFACLDFGHYPDSFEVSALTHITPASV